MNKVSPINLIKVILDSTLIERLERSEIEKKSLK